MAKKDKREAFVFLRAWMKPLEKLSAEDRLNYLNAIIACAFGEPYEQYLNSPIVDTLFTLVADDIERGKAHQEQVTQARIRAGKARMASNQSSTSNDTTDEQSETPDRSDSAQSFEEHIAAKLARAKK